MNAPPQRSRTSDRTFWPEGYTLALTKQVRNCAAAEKPNLCRDEVMVARAVVTRGLASDKPFADIVRQHQPPFTAVREVAVRNTPYAGRRGRTAPRRQGQLMPNERFSRITGLHFRQLKHMLGWWTKRSLS